MGLGVGTWLSTHLIIFFFYITSYIFSIALHTRLGLSILLILGVSHCICSQLLDPMEIQFLCSLMVGRGWPFMILSEMILWPL